MYVILRIELSDCDEEPLNLVVAVTLKLDACYGDRDDWRREEDAEHWRTTNIPPRPDFVISFLLVPASTPRKPLRSMASSLVPRLGTG